MSKNLISGIYLRASGQEPKLVVKRKVGPFQDQYDVSRPWDKIDIVRDLVKLLEKECEGFLEKFVKVDEKHYKTSSHRVRRYIAKNRADLYPTKDEEFTKSHSFSHKGYWIGTNIGAKEITQYVREMCEACDISFGSCSEIKF